MARRGASAEDDSNILPAECKITGRQAGFVPRRGNVSAFKTRKKGGLIQQTMINLDEISAARNTLELPERATMQAIKSSYRKMLARWHPDKCAENKEECADMTRRIISAYQTIMEYCVHYQFSFSEDAVKKHQSSEERWFERFRDDPLWGNGRSMR